MLKLKPETITQDIFRDLGRAFYISVLYSGGTQTTKGLTEMVCVEWLNNRLPRNLVCLRFG